MQVNSAPFVVNERDTEYSTLDTTDVGKWCVLVRGCYHVFETEQDAQSCANALKNQESYEHEST